LPTDPDPLAEVVQINEPGQDQQPDEPVGVAVPSELDPKVAS
jgi:hypothetical protein